MTSINLTNFEQQKCKTTISTGLEGKLSFLNKTFKFLFLLYFFIVNRLFYI